MIDGKLKRDTINQSAEFNDWVSELHKILIKKKLSGQISFSTGSNTKTIILILLLVICVAGAFAAFAIDRIGIACTLFGAIALITTLLFKIGLKKEYDPESKIIS